METSRFASKLQIAWAVDEDNMPIFSSEFISGLILSRRIALFNPGSLPVWIVRVGFRRPNSTRHAAALEQCDPHLSGFSVALCDADGSTASSRDRPKMVDEAMGVFELKPDEQRWLEVLYTPDFLHSEINVELCLFVSLRSPTAERSVRLGKGIIDLDPNRGDRGSQSVSSFFTCNESSVSDCSLFQPDPIRLTAKISPSLAYLCYSSLLRPDFEANLWSLLLFVFASNLAGIFVVASFDAVRMLAFHESCRQLLLPTASSINTSEIEQQGSPSLLAPQLLNLPLVGQNQQQENSALPYLRALGNTIVQPFSDDNTNNRRRTHRPSVSKVSITNAIGKFAKSLTRSLRNGAIRASKTVYGPVSRSVWAPGKHFSSLFTSYWGQAGESGRSAPRKLVKSTAEASSIIRSQTQSRKVGTDNSEIINVAILASRRSSDDIKRTPKQSNTKFGGELTSTSANVTQASVDGEGATLCTSQSSNGNCLKSRVNGAKQNSVVVSPSEWAISSKSASGSTLAMNGALKKHLLSVPSVSTTPSSPKMRVSRPAAQRSPTPPPLPPPPPSLIMESIRVESASMGVKKPKQFVPQQQSSSQQFTCKPVSTLPQPQGFTKLVNNRNGCIKETLSVKQKSPSVSTYDSVESSAQRKKSEKKVTALPKQPNPIVLPAPVIPAWQPRKAWTSVELSETPQSTVNESSRFGLPLTSAWTATSRLTESDVNEPSGKIRPGDLEFPPLGTVPSKRPMRTSLDDEESSCLAVDTSEYDTQIRYLPSTSTTASGHHFRYTGNCHDISPRSQQQQQYSFQNRFTAPHIATPPLHRSNFVITNTQVARRHRTRLCNPSISMTTLLNPQSFSGSYLTQFATSANAFSSNFTAGYVKQDFVPMRQHVYEPLTGTCDGVHINLHGHRRRRSSTGQIFSDGFSPNTGITGNHESTDLMFHSSHKSAMDLSTILPKKEEENANDLYSPEWINAFDTPPPKDVEVSISGSTPPCELQQLTETRFKCMLMHERRGRMSSEVESELSILKDMSIVDSEEYVPPNLLNDLTPDDPFSGNEYRQTGFNKTMGGQLSNTERSPPTVSLTGTIQEIPDAFDVFQKTWLPAFLPWRSRFPVEDPTGDQDLVEPTLYLTLRSDVSGSIIQEPSESTTMTDGKAKGQLITNTDEKLPIHDVGLHE